MNRAEQARYRVRQFLRRLCVRREQLDLAPATAVLAGEALALFCSMPAGDQQHALCVLQSLHAAGEPPAELAQAALLHDVGKLEGGLALPYRVAIVLLEALRPNWLEGLALKPGRLWRPFHVHVHHAELGADLCQRAGCPALTVRLVRRHKGPAPATWDDRTLQMLTSLREADDRC